MTSVISMDRLEDSPRCVEDLVVQPFSFPILPHCKDKHVHNYIIKEPFITSMWIQLLKYFLLLNSYFFRICDCIQRHMLVEAEQWVLSKEQQYPESVLQFCICVFFCIWIVYKEILSVEQSRGCWPRNWSQQCESAAGPYHAELASLIVHLLPMAEMVSLFSIHINMNQHGGIYLTALMILMISIGVL